MTILKMENITFRHNNSKEKILSQANAEFSIGQFYAIVGKSGAGKTTLLSLLAGLDVPEKGRIVFDDNDIASTSYNHHRKNNISIVFQNYNLIDYLTPLENIRLVNKAADKSILLELGLEEKHIHRNVLKLSGGQQQRVAIARALVSNAPVILADEPTGNLDEGTSAEIIKILKKLALSKNKCVIVVTHSKEVANAADKIFELKNKNLVEIKSASLSKVIGRK